MKWARQADEKRAARWAPIGRWILLLLGVGIGLRLLSQQPGLRDPQRVARRARARLRASRAAPAPAFSLPYPGRTGLWVQESGDDVPDYHPVSHMRPRNQFWTDPASVDPLETPPVVGIGTVVQDEDTAEALRRTYDSLTGQALQAWAWHVLVCEQQRDQLGVLVPWARVDRRIELVRDPVCYDQYNNVLDRLVRSPAPSAVFLRAGDALELGLLDKIAWTFYSLERWSLASVWSVYRETTSGNLRVWKKGAHYGAALQAEVRDIAR